VVAHTGVQPLFVTPDPERFAGEFGDMHWHHEEPGLTGSHYNEWCVMRTARSNGCIVMLDGQGSDEVLGGYQYYFPLYQRDLAVRRQWCAMLTETILFARRMRREAARYHRPERRFSPKGSHDLRTLLHFSWSRSLPDGSGEPGMPALEDGFFRRQIGRGLLYDQLPRQLHAADRSAMAFGVESRFPFLDHELVDWCLRLPDEALTKRGWQKYVLRRAFDGQLPREVSWRADKVGYAAPQDEWLRGPLRSWAEARLFSPRLQDYSFYDGAALRKAFEEHQTGRANRETILWRWLSIEQFSRLFEEGAWQSTESSAAAAPTLGP